jgi:hypothetical protein
VPNGLTDVFEASVDELLAMMDELSPATVVAETLQDRPAETSPIDATILAGLLTAYEGSTISLDADRYDIISVLVSPATVHVSPESRLYRKLPHLLPLTSTTIDKGRLQRIVKRMAGEKTVARIVTRPADPFERVEVEARTIRAGLLSHTQSNVRVEELDHGMYLMVVYPGPRRFAVHPGSPLFGPLRRLHRAHSR